MWPQARLHTQWPGTGMAGDPNFDQFFASQVPFVQNPEVTQALNRDAIAALIDQLGPVILMTHSQSGAYVSVSKLLESSESFGFKGGGLIRGGTADVDA